MGNSDMGPAFVCCQGVMEPRRSVTMPTKCHLEALWGVMILSFNIRGFGKDDESESKKPKIGKSCGLMMIWDPTAFDVSEAINKPFIQAIKGRWQCKQKDTIVINVYGPHKDNDKKRFWKILESVTDLPDVEWVIDGDFNEVCFQQERQNCYMFSERKTLDHYPILLRDKNEDVGPKPFKVFNVWLENKKADNIVVEAWNKPVGGSRPDCILRNKLKNFKEVLRVWSKTKYGVIDEEIESWKHKAESLESKAENNNISESERLERMNARNKWFKREKEKCDMLRPKSRQKWCAEGGETTSYFHSSIRRKNNKSNIRGLHINGIWEENPNEIKKAIFDHFQNCFKLHQSSKPRLETLNNFQFQKLNTCDAENLETPFLEEDIWNAIKDCDSNKSLGPDGFNMYFFKCFYWLIKDDLQSDPLVWENGSKGCNASFFTLILKTNEILKLGDYRPISLIVSYYKIVSKILTHRVQKVISKIIGYEQSAFIKGRYILDSILVENEVIDATKKNKTKGLIFKADFQKTFDSIHWEFLFKIMENMGFGKKNGSSGLKHA
ncbi:uncharacterized protein [Rutidosis leptorrhynchoides]|uniref:uncharacterized protein n=1 Tax=Rutidosis leptorrhynchoides TaxID=125765 RepID=UPI003A99051F